MVRREQNADLLNRITNVDDVLPFVTKLDGNVDWTPAFESRVNGIVVLSNGEDAAVVFWQMADRAWQCCTVFANTCRGKRAVELGREIRDWMIPKWADVIFGSIRNDLRHAMWFYRQMGGERADKVMLDNGEAYVANPDETLFVLGVK